MRPLQDVRILAIEQYGAGPYGSLHLADLGADVIKIETPGGGDIGRGVVPFAAGGDSLFFETFNRNKRSIVLDLNAPAGRRVFERLVGTADAVYSNLRGDVVERMGIRYCDLARHNPRIVCCSLSGFGQTGPRRDQPAFDYMLQGLSGWMSLTGEPDGPPAKSGLSVVDYSAGLAAACALLAGLHAAARDGAGCDCDVSLFDTAYSMLSYVATWYLTEQFTPQRQARSAHPSMTPFQLYPTADGWIVAGGSKEKFWTRLAAALDRPELATDPRFATFADRRAHRDELTGILDELFAARPTHEWVPLLEELGVPCAPVNDIAAALEDPQVRERELIVRTEHPRFGRVRTMASPVRVGEPAAHHERAPRAGEHGPDILRSLLGCTDTEFAALAAAGAFGPPDDNAATGTA
ncbi:MAG TPA: CoA transferase [Mycobacteriales bacterium]|nr:CoA transferase [Mycobacteriales bacterium]